MLISTVWLGSLTAQTEKTTPSEEILSVLPEEPGGQAAE